MIVWKQTKTVKKAELYLINHIKTHLDKGEKVLWLVPGGSAADLAVKAASQIDKAASSRLFITLTDERYGPPGHKDSNWQQLMDKGFGVDGATLAPVLDGTSLHRNAMSYSNMLIKLIGETDFSIAFAGMGADGHIFGIKPRSPSVNSGDFVDGYEWEDYDRLTPTFKFLRKLDEIIIYAAGKEKWPQFQRLDKAVEPEIQPAQFLKRLKKVIILNDYKGDSL